MPSLPAPKPPAPSWPTATSAWRITGAPSKKANPPSILLTWIREVEDDRVAAERELAAYAAKAQPLTEAEVRALAKALLPHRRFQCKVLRSLAKATPEERAAMYRELGVRLTYNPAEPDSVVVEVPACTGLRVGGGT